MKKFLRSACCIVLSLVLTLSGVLSASAAPTTDDIVAAALIIIRENEGNYNSINKDDNGALSIGFLQWHANRALNLLRDIISRNDENAKLLLGDALYAEITDSSTSWSTRTLTTDEAALMKALLSTDESKAAQDELASSNVLSYVTHGMNLGISSPSALVYFADMENQCGSGGSARVAKAAATLAGEGEITLDILHQAALADAAAGKYSSRRNKVYNYSLILGWENTEDSEKYEVWITTATLNVRSGPGTTYDKVTSYTNGTYIAVYEKTEVGETTWGRTPAGWVSLAYCSYVTNPFESIASSTRFVEFDAAGGTLSSDAKATLTVNIVNGYRATNYLAIYNSAHGTSSGANKYGTEMQVDASGLVISDPEQYVGNMAIPDGGMVLSAHGTAINTLTGAVKKGNYVYFDVENMLLEVYEDENTYLAARKNITFGEAYGKLPVPAAPSEGLIFTGWFTDTGALIDETTVAEKEHSSVLTAGWTGNEFNVSFDLDGGYFEGAETATYTVDVVNKNRLEDYMVVYDGSNGKTTSGTNKYGVDIAIPADGIVTEDPVLRTYNLEIPEGGFVLSGHNKACNWIMANISKGCYVEFDYETMTLTVWSSYSDYVGPTMTVMSGVPVGELPMPKKEGYSFTGWVDENGNTVTADTILNVTSDVTLTATWKSDRLYGDVNCDGKINLLDIYVTLAAIRSSQVVEGTYPDANEDNSINISDVYTVKKIIIEG